MRRVAVLGCGGAGKTALANALGDALGLPVIHSDFYRPGWEKAHPSLIARDEWVIDAMRLGTLEERLNRADTAIFLDVGPFRCLWGVLRRRLRYRGGLHDDGVADFVNWEFIRWIATFPRRHRPRIHALLAAHGADTHVVVLGSRRAANAYVRAARARATAPKQQTVTCGAQASVPPHGEKLGTAAGGGRRGAGAGGRARRLLLAPARLAREEPPRAH